MNETNERQNSWKWAAIALGVILVLLMCCLTSAFWGGMIGFALGRGSHGRMMHDYEEPYMMPYPEMPMPPFEDMPWEDSPWEGDPWNEDEWEEIPWDEFMEERPWLGVYFDMVDEGALITDVVPDSPAGDAGIRVDDIIIEVDGEPVDWETPLSARILMHEPGERVKITVLRDGDEETFRVKLGVRPMGEFPFEREFEFEMPPSYGG